MTIRHISSKANPWFRKIKELSNDNKAYRDHQLVWIEGEHLCRAAINRDWKFADLVMHETTSSDVIEFWTPYAKVVTILSDSLMVSLSTLPSSTWIGGTIDLPKPINFNSNQSAVILDRLQDPGNVGSILRSAAAFGFKQVFTTPQTVALWSSKVVRAAMGAHFNIHLYESISSEFLLALNLPVLATSSHHGQSLHNLLREHHLPSPCLWVFGHEGQGADAEWFDKAYINVKIDQPGGEESLNVAAAAAICLYASASQSINHSRA
jgi:TrmH family RNA methyltransferase